MRRNLKSLVTVIGILSAAAIATIVVLRSGPEMPEQRSQGQESSSQVSVAHTVLGSSPSAAHVDHLSHDRNERREDKDGHEDFTGSDAMTTNGHDDAESTEISAAIADFQTQARSKDGYKVARKLLPLIKVGMTPQEVRAILGEPSRLLEDGRYWYYGLFYSQFIEVEFDPNGQVKKVTSALLADQAQE